jgi:dethiobiotin synthetase
VKRGYFVTGSDTGVGKTFVSCAMARALVGRGNNVFAFKPIESGGSEDQRALVGAAGAWQTGELAGVYTLKRPAAPLVAARDEGIEIDIERITRVFARGSELADFSIVEGAGGWRVPVTESADMAALARAVGLPVIIVTRATLGTINHTLLTVEAVERDGCRVAGVVMSLRPEEDRAFAEENREQIAMRWPGPIEIYGDASALSRFV